jgi:1-pyrroline-5-carboxylate dehydrogenase
MLPVRGQQSLSYLLSRRFLMSNAFFQIPEPINDPVRNYEPGSPDRALLKETLAQMQAQEIEVPLYIGGQEIRTGDIAEMRAPHDHSIKLGSYHKAGEEEVKLAIEAALDARADWAAMPWEHRLSIILKAADLLTGSLEGFVFAVTPFNFTSIAGNLPTAPAMMGNTVIWKPASSARLQRLADDAAASRRRGAPMASSTSSPAAAEVGDTLLADPDLGGIHFTGSTAVFQGMWKTMGQNIERLPHYPRIVGETGGKDFIFAHPSADVRTPCHRAGPRRLRVPGPEVLGREPGYIPQPLWERSRTSSGVEQVARSRWAIPPTSPTSWAR